MIRDFFYDFMPSRNKNTSNPLRTWPCIQNGISKKIQKPLEKFITKTRDLHNQNKRLGPWTKIKFRRANLKQMSVHLSRGPAGEDRGQL